MEALTDEERLWIKDLEKSLWPKDRKNPNPVKLEAHRQLTHDERDRVFKDIETFGLVVEMFSSNMFGGYGIAIYEHELYPHTGPQYLLAITEDNLPPPSRLERATGDSPKVAKKVPGSGRDDAWELFSKFTHSDQMREWVDQYKLNKPRERDYYDY